MDIMTAKTKVRNLATFSCVSCLVFTHKIMKKVTIRNNEMKTPLLLNEGYEYVRPPPTINITVAGLKRKDTI